MYPWRTSKISSQHLQDNSETKKAENGGKERQKIREYCLKLVQIFTDWLQDFMSNYVYTEYESNLGSNEHYVENISQLTCYLSW